MLGIVSNRSQEQHNTRTKEAIMASNITQDVQEQFLSTIRKGQEMTIDAL